MAAEIPASRTACRRTTGAAPAARAAPAAAAPSTRTAGSARTAEAPEAAAARLIQLLHLPRPQPLLQLLGKLRRIGRGRERLEAEHADETMGAARRRCLSGGNVTITSGRIVRSMRTKSPRISSCPHF